MFRELAFKLYFKVLLGYEYTRALVFVYFPIVFKAIKRSFYKLSASVNNLYFSGRIVSYNIYKLYKVTIIVYNLFSGRIALDRAVIVIDLPNIINNRPFNVFIYITYTKRVYSGRDG